MNILFVHEVDWLKKVVFEIHNISELMSLAGHRVFAVDYEDSWQGRSLRLSNLKTREFSNVARAVPGAAVTLRRPGFLRLPGLSRLTAAVTTAREIERIIKAEHIDIIVLYAVPTSGLQTVALAKKYNIPVVFRAIDILYRMVKYPMLRLPARMMEKRVYRRVDRVLAIAPRYARYVASMGVPESRIRQVLMPVDTGMFKPEKEPAELRGHLGIHERDRVIVFVGTLFNFSGLDDFIRHFPKVLAAVPEAQLVIVGDGPQRARLDNLIVEMELGKRVLITGFQPYETMVDYINLAEVCVNTFRNTPVNEDIFPGKIIQYIACGKAVVSTPLKGITSILPGPSHGIVYAERENMAAAVINLLQSPAKRHELGRAGLAYVLENHSYQSIARQFEAELADVIARRKQGMTATGAGAGK
jgi:glycosyltransferase involved in cell wall biosynthesis